MKRLRAYTHYAAPSSEWLGPVPSHWTVSRFGLEMAVNVGQVDPREEPWASTVLIAPNHVEAGTGRIVGRETAAEQGADSGKYVVKSGQIIYSKIRPALNKVAIAPEDCLCSADMYGLSSLRGDEVRYAAYFMRSRPFHDYADVMSARVKMPKVNRAELSAAPWLRPPMAEQRAIADFLDRETARVGDLIDKQEHLIATLIERRTAIASQLLGDRIGAGDRLKWSLQPVDQRVGAEWQQYALMSVSIAWGVRRRDEVTADESRAEDLSAYKICRADDLVINRMRAFQGALGVAPEVGLTSPDYAVLRPDAALDSRWIAALMRSLQFVSEMARRIRGIGGVEDGNVRTPRINVADLLDIRVDVPSIEEQIAVRSEIEAQTAKINALISRTQEFIEVAKERRSALVTAVATGQLDVLEAHAVREHDSAKATGA